MNVESLKLEARPKRIRFLHEPNQRPAVILGRYGRCRIRQVRQSLPLAAAVRILVIDDDVDGANGLAALLTQAGHDVKVAYDGTQALALAVAFAAEAAIVDLTMPDMDGFEVARGLRNEYGASLLLIAFSGHEDVTTRRSVEGSGFDRFVRKPASLASLSKALQR